MGSVNTLGSRRFTYSLALQKRTFQLSQKRTSLNGPYKHTSHNVYYVKLEIGVDYTVLSARARDLAIPVSVFMR